MFGLEYFNVNVSLQQTVYDFSHINCYVTHWNSLLITPFPLSSQWLEELEVEC